jgi:hypothetical protein
MSKTNLLERRSVVSSLLKDRKDAVVVGGLGASTYDITAAGANRDGAFIVNRIRGALGYQPI